MSCRELVFLHFNDVYHMSNGESIARFLTQLQSYRRQYEHLTPYTVFSGDVFSPSLEASILRGAHMLPLLKELQVDLGCYGNHDFDFGQDRLCELSSETPFPWLLSNVTRPREKDEAGDSANGPRPAADDGLLASARKYHVAELQGIRVGFLGLAGTDWPSNCWELPPCNIASPVDVARECSRHLRQVERCDVVVAVTHMRLPEDIQVSEALHKGPADERVDLLLGGHDHDVLRRYGGEVLGLAADPQVIDCGFSNKTAVQDGSGMVPEARGNVRIVKSGTDWNGLSCVRLRVNRTAAGVAKVQGVAVEQVIDVGKVELDAVSLSENRRRIDESLRAVNARIDEVGREPLLHTSVALEGSGSVMRARETNLGNMLADMVRAFYDVDIALVNSGSVRCDRLIHATTGAGAGKKPLTVRDLMEISPFNNPLRVKRIGSAAMLDALENSFSDAHTDGRFLHFSGLKVTADWSRSQGERVLEACHLPPGQGKPGAPRRITRDDRLSFTVAMAAFIADGFDGYVSFADQETLVGDQGAVTDTELLLRTLGYTPDHGVKPKQDTVDDEERRFSRARASIVVEWDSAGLPIVAPMIEERIVAVNMKGRQAPIDSTEGTKIV